MGENTLLNYFFESGGAQKASQFGLNRKSRSKRMREIVFILHKHKFLNQLTPEEFRAALEELGPSFVKIGQTLSTRSEILPKAYCEELTKLQTECDQIGYSAGFAAGSSASSGAASSAGAGSSAGSSADAGSSAASSSSMISTSTAAAAS